MDDRVSSGREYVFAAVIVLIAATLRAAIGVFGVRIPFVTFYPAVMISGIYGGMRAGLLATALSAVLTAYFWMEPPGIAIANPTDWIILTIFISTCTLLSYTADLMYRAQARAKRAEAQAELAAERERAAIAVQENEERLRLAIESGNLGTWDFNPHTGEINWSDRCKEIFGLPPGAHIDYQLFSDCIHPDDRQRVHDAEQAAMDPSGNGRLNIEFRSKLPDGTVRWLATTAKVFFSDMDERPKAARMIGTVADITERREIEDALREGEERLRVMADTIPQLAWVARADGYIHWYNKRWYEFTGTTPEQMEGWGWQRVHDPNVLPDVLERWKESIATGKPFDMVFPLRGADGNFRQFLTRVQPVKNADGEVTQWCGTNTDVTERMWMEEVLRKSRDELELRVRERTAELEEANEALRDQAALLDLAHDAILVRGMNDKIIFWNTGATETYGFSKEEALGRTTHELLRTRFPEQLDQIKERVIQYGSWQGELLHTTSTGGEIIVESRWGLKADITGKPTGILEINRDVTDRKKAEKTLKSNMERLELINSELQEFAFVASHDLQEPLRKIQTFCDLTKQRCAMSLDHAGQDYLERVINSAARMRQLLEDLLQYSRVASKSEPFRQVDLGEIARDAADVFEQKIEETGAQIEIKNLPKIEADESQMLRLFQNLIGNALKFRSEKIPHIEVYAKCDGNTFCEIFVKDNGIGFDQIYAEKIFKPFQRLYARSEYEGTGMGLAICRKIAERHGGSIRAESEQGKGSTFILRLPGKQVKSELEANAWKDNYERF